MNFDLEILAGFFDEAKDALNRWEQIGLEFKKNNTSSEIVQELFRIAHNLKGGSRAVGLGEFGELIHKIEDGITLLRDGQIPIDSKTTEQVLEAQKVLSDWLECLRFNPEFSFDYGSFLKQYSRCFFEKAQSEEPEAEPVELKPEAELPPMTVATDEVKRHHLKVSQGSKPSAAAHETIRISAAKLDQLIQTIGEISIHQSIVWHTKSEESSLSRIFTNSLQLSQKLTKELYDKALGLRMQPLQSVFQRLERNISDLSKTLEKEVLVEVIGSDVELDKAVIEKIIDPLTHIVRNAVDHGIESSEFRAEKGKSKQGQVLISAVQDTYGVVLTIKDDGKGLDSKRIHAKAIERGLVRANDVLSEAEIFQMIFWPGFSTADKVTDVSGRGVGMDVVRKTLEELSGSIRIQSEIDKGTSFVITLPTSVSIIDAMVVAICGQNYVVPVSSVEEVIEARALKINSDGQMCSLRGSVIPLHHLYESLKHKKSDVPSSSGAALVCHLGNQKIGLMVDKVLGQQQVVIRPLNENIKGAFGFLGGTILGNGEPGLILDIPQIVENYLKKYKVQEVPA